MAKRGVKTSGRKITLKEARARKDDRLAQQLIDVLDGTEEEMAKTIAGWPRAVRNLFYALDGKPEAWWGDLTVDELAEMVQEMTPRPGAPMKASTSERIRLAVKLTRQGVSLYKQAAQLFPKKSQEQAYSFTRAFHARYRDRINVGAKNSRL